MAGSGENMGSGSTRFYEEIEPFCRWRRTQDIDLLEIHLPPGSKKDHLRIQINNNGILTITGDCPVEQTKSIRFKKETKVDKNCRRNEIRAKFSKGILHVTMPKTSPNIATNESSKENMSEILNPNFKPCNNNMINSQDKTKLMKSEIGSKLGLLKQRLWRKRTVEGVAAMVVVVAAVLGVVKLYQCFMASPV